MTALRSLFFARLVFDNRGFGVIDLLSDYSRLRQAVEEVFGNAGNNYTGLYRVQTKELYDKKE